MSWSLRPHCNNIAGVTLDVMGVRIHGALWHHTV